MIKAISYWSLPGGLEGSLPPAQALSLAKQAEFPGLELAIAPEAPQAPEGGLSVASPQAQCEAIRRQIDVSGVEVQTLASGMSWGVNPTSDDPAVRARAVELHAAALRRAAWLGCRALLFVPGIVGCPFIPDVKIRYDVALDRTRDAVKQLLPVAEEVGVDLCLENVWNGMFLSPVELRSFIESFGSERLGVYFDVGNLLGYHQHPPHWIEILGPVIKRVHVKDFKHRFGWQGTYHFCDLLEGDVPWAETMAALRKIGYDKTLVAEMLPYREGLPEKTSAALDRILAM